jgi:hypothetical protein
MIILRSMPPDFWVGEKMKLIRDIYSRRLANYGLEQ